jgi:hypothetical protein
LIFLSLPYSTVLERSLALSHTAFHQASTFFVLATSDDDGETWSKPRLVVDSHSKNLPRDRSILVGNLWTDPLGRLWCFFDQSLGYFDGRCGDWYIRCDDPDAAEPKWTAPVRFADGCTLNKPTVLSNGDWLLPVALWTRDRMGGPGVNKEAHKDLDVIRMANVFASTDQGKTWTRRSGVACIRRFIKASSAISCAASGVRIKPGETALTRTPCGPHSTAKLRASCASAAFDKP